jgi:hypothetical protein
MSGSATPAVGDSAELVGTGEDPPPHRRRRWPLVVLVLVLVAAGLAVAVSGVLRSSSSASSVSGSSDNAAATSTQPVTRQSLSETTPVDGTLGYAGSYDVVGQLQGTVTALPAPGKVIGQGQVLFRVNGKPVVLLYGSTPAYRMLAEGATAADVTGTDVAELNRDLVALGYDSGTDLPSTSDQFSSATKAGVKRLQAHLGVAQNGTLALGHVVFLPGAARVSSVPAVLGGPAGGLILTATSTTREVSVNLDADLQSRVKKGDSVAIELPDNTSTPGRVASVGTVATTPSSSAPGPGGTPTVAVLIRPAHPQATGNLDQAPVQVAITTATVPDALAVPVNALLALAGGGYAVEVAADSVHRLVSVTLGLFDDADGLVQVTGSGLAAGQHVVVPGS